MGTKTVDGADSGTETKKGETVTSETAVDVTKAEEQGGAMTEAAADEVAAQGAVEETAEEAAEEAVEDSDAGLDGDLDGRESPSGVGQGAAAVVSAVLGLVSLNGGWIGTVASARENLVGQLQTASNASVTTQLKELYGDAWQATALWAGLFALVGLFTGVAVLARPAFGAPGKSQAPWIKSVAWAGVSLGVVGLLLAVLKYSDALLALPSAK